MLLSLDCIEAVRRFTDAGLDGTGTAWTATMEEVSRRAKREIEGRALEIAESGLPFDSFDTSDRLLFVLHYELSNPDHRAMMDDFLDPLRRAVLLDDILNIKFITYNSPEPYGCLIFQYLPGINIVDNNNNGNPHYKLGDRAISVNFTDLAHRGYGTFFHELGHAIDHAMTGGTDTSASGFASLALYDVLEQDVFAHIESTVRRFVCDEEDIAAIMAAFRYCGNPDNLTEAQRQDFYDVVDDYIRTQGLRYRNGPQRSASITFGGFTDIRIRTDANGTEEGRGHGRYHPMTGELMWYDADGESTGAHGREFFADMFSTNVRRDTVEAEQNSIYFPNAVIEMEDLIRDHIN